MRLFRALAVLCLLAPFAAAGQYSIDKVVFENSAPYTDAELLTTSGFAPGQLLSNDSLSNGGQHLLDTGLFSDVQVSLSGQGKARTVHVALKPTPLADLLPVGFENLVWFTPEELTQGLRARVPLYRGVAAEAGNFQDAIQAALLDMLKEKGVVARLSRDVPGPTVQHPQRVVEFHVDQPAVRLLDVHLSLSAPTGLAVKMTPGLQKAVNTAIHSPFNEGLSGVTLADLLLTPARDAGFATAHLDNISRTFAPTANGIGVTYTARIVSGDIYTLSAIAWEPTALYSAADFAKDNTLHAGDIAGLTALNATEAKITTAYLAHGYMDVAVLATPTLDESAHTVSYTLKVIPGEVYHLNSVTLNLSPEAQKLFNTVWTMKSGDPYNDHAIKDFFIKTLGQPNFKNYVPDYRVSTDPQTHLVDLSVTFIPGPR
jgi:outer membrane protein assembly factor BamA